MEVLISGYLQSVIKDKVLYYFESALYCLVDDIIEAKIVFGSSKIK